MSEENKNELENEVVEETTEEVVETVKEAEASTADVIEEKIEAVVEAADTHAQAGGGAGGFGGDQGGEGDGCAQTDGGEDEGQRGRSDDADEDILVLGAQHTGSLDERLIHVDHALIDGDAHGEEAGDGDDDDLRLAADAGSNYDQRHISQRGDVADELDPGLNDEADRLIPGHEDGHGQRDHKAQNIAPEYGDEAGGNVLE